MSTNATALTTPPPETTTTATTTTNGTNGASQDWRASLPDDLKAEKSFEKFKGVPDLAKSYVEIQKTMGNAVKMPKADSPEADWNAFYDKIGRPASPDKYELKKPETPAGGKWDDKLQTDFQTAAHKVGLAPRQAQGLLDWFNETQTASVNEYTASMTQGVESLKKEWGADWETKVSLAQRAVTDLGGEEVKSLLAETGLGNHPALIKLFARLGEQMTEDTLVTGDTHQDSSGADAIQLKIAAIRSDPKHPYNDSKASFQAHDAAIREMGRLYEQLALAQGAEKEVTTT